MIVLKSKVLFVFAGLCEIGGYLIWLWVKEEKRLYYAILRGIILILYSVIQRCKRLTLQECMPLMAEFLKSCHYYGHTRWIIIHPANMK